MSHYIMSHKYGERTREFLGAFLFPFQSSFPRFWGVFNKTIIPLALVGYEMIIANSAIRASLAVYHLISNARSWNSEYLLNMECLYPNMDMWASMKFWPEKDLPETLIFLALIFRQIDIYPSSHLNFVDILFAEWAAKFGSETCASL